MNDTYQELNAEDILSDFRLLIRKQIIFNEKVRSIEGYEKVKGHNLVYNIDYELYYNKTEFKYALINELVNDENATIYSIYVLDYSNMEVYKEILGNENSEPYYEPNVMTTVLYIFGTIFMIASLLLFTYLDDFDYAILLLFTLSFGLIFFALGTIIKILRNK